MRHFNFTLCMIFLWLINMSCKENLQAKSQLTTNVADTLASAIPSSNGIKEIGLLSKAEDSGYPFMSLTIEFPEKNRIESFTINLEEVPNVDINTVQNAVGKYISFEYDSNLDNMLYDLTFNDKSLFGEVATSSDDEILTITGILSNAAEATAGDLPGQVFITTEEEITEKFDVFITPEMVSANGKTVTGYYQKQVNNVITKLKVND
jgi:hypothetical protein